MNKRTELTWFKFLGFKGPKNIKSVTLIELIISIMVVAIMVLSFYSLETYGHQQVMSADRRTKVQNSLAYCLEHMSKYVQQASGNFSRKAIQYYPNPLDATSATGFSVLIDLNNPPTPSVFTDDGRIDYILSVAPPNTIITTCTPNGGTCPGTTEINVITTENLTDKIIAGVAGDTIMPDTGDPYISPYSGPASGFYIKIGSDSNTLATFVDISLVGRYYPTQVPTLTTKLTNPQAAMKTRLICNNSSTN